MDEAVYHDESGRTYAVRDGVSVWLDAPASTLTQWPQFEYVGYGPRFAARLIDMVIIYALALLVAVPLGLYAGLAGNRWLIARLTDGSPSPASFAVSLAAATVFYVIAESMHGSTPGKMVLGLRVVSEDGTPCGFLQAVKRAVAFFVDSLFFGAPALVTMGKTPLRQRIGDTWAKTVVVKARSLSAEQRSSGAVFARAAAVTCLAYMALSLLSVIL